jgi:hypothetical protein
VLRKATAVAGTVFVALVLLTSAAQARAPERPSARLPSQAAADRGGDGNRGHGNQGNGQGNGHGNGNQGNGHGNGHGSAGGPAGGANTPGVVTASESAAAQRVLDEVLAASGDVSAKLRVALARFLGQPGSPAPSPTQHSATGAASTSAARGPAAQSTVLVTAGDPAARARQPARPGSTSGETAATQSTSARSAPRRGPQPVSLPLLPAADTWAVTAVFGFFVLGLLWTAWMASLRPVLGRGTARSARATATGDAIAPDSPALHADAFVGTAAVGAPQRRPGSHRR